MSDSGIYFGGPLHGQKLQHDPSLRDVCVKLEDPHRVSFKVQENLRPDCLEQKEIVALTGRTYQRPQLGLLKEDRERDQLLYRWYQGHLYVINGRTIEVFFYEGYSPESVDFQELAKLAFDAGILG